MTESKRSGSALTWIFVAVLALLVIYSVSRRRSGKSAESEKAETAGSGSEASLLQSKPDPRAGFQEKLRSLRVGKVDLKNSTPSEALRRLAEASRKSDPEGVGINIVFLGGETGVKTAGSAEKGAETAGTAPFFDELKRIRDKFDLRFRVEGRAVLVAPNGIPLVPMEYRMFDWNCLWERLGGGQDPGRPIDFKKTLKKLKKEGVAFPKGSMLVQWPTYSVFAVRNTPRELDKIDRIAGRGERGGPNVYVEIKTVEIPERLYRQAEKKHGSIPPADFWRDAILSGKATIVEGRAVLGENAEEIQLRSVDEVYFPEGWSEIRGNGEGDQEESAKSEKGGKESPRRAPVAPAKGIVVPEMGEPTELGGSLTVNPEIKDDGKIHIQGSSFRQYLTGWTRENGNFPMPVIAASQNEFDITVQSAAWVLLGSKLVDDSQGRSGASRTRRATLLRATILDPNGPPSRPWLPKGPGEEALSKAVTPEFDIELAAGAAPAELAAKLSAASRDANSKASFAVLAEGGLPAPISLHLRGASLFDILRYACLQSGLEYSVDGSGATLTAPDEMATVSLETPKSLLKNSLSLPDTLVDEKISAMGSERLRSLLEEAGIHFPAGSRCVVSRDGDKTIATITNTRRNLAFAIATLRCYSMPTPRILVDSSLVEIGQRDLESIIGKESARWGRLSEEQLETILASPKSRISMSLTISAPRGEEAVGHDFSETYYPESWTLSKDGRSMVPEFGSTWDLGKRVTVVPDIYALDNIVSLDSNIQIYHFKGFSEYTVKGLDARGARIRMPIITNYLAHPHFDSPPEHLALAGWTVYMDGGKNVLTPDTSPTPPRDWKHVRNVLCVIKTHVTDESGRKAPSMEEIFHAARRSALTAPSARR